MATEYALVDDASGHAFDLGKGPWYEWSTGRRHTYDDGVGLPKTPDEILAFFRYWAEASNYAPKIERWCVRLTEAILAWIDAHPDARVVPDSGDCTWFRFGTKDREDEVRDMRARGVHVYEQVLSRYDDAIAGGA